MNKKISLKQRLKSGEVVFGTCFYSFSPCLVTLAGYCGFDWLRIDNEHSWRQDHTLESMIRASMIGGITSITRIDNGNPDLIKKVLEIGSDGFLIPHVRTGEEVVNIVKAAKFPPIGNRGYGSQCLSAHYGTMKPQDWVKRSNEELLVGVMIEEPIAVKNIDSIMSVEGLDYVLFGPGDYSILLGLGAPNLNHPEVQEALKRTISSAKKHGKYVMIGVGDPWDINAKKYIEMGCQMIEIGHDTTVLRNTWKRILANIKK